MSFIIYINLLIGKGNEILGTRNCEKTNKKKVIISRLELYLSTQWENSTVVKKTGDASYFRFCCLVAERVWCFTDASAGLSSSDC